MNVKPSPSSQLNRRQLLQIGGIGLLNLSLPRLLRAEKERREKPRADSCILIFLNGGPSHLDMWDMKPNAPAEVRGPFKPVNSTLPGVPLSEHLPQLAKHLHRCTLVRSVHHTVYNAHSAAVYTALTGHDRGDPARPIYAGPDDYPAIGSAVGRLRPPGGTFVPYVSMPYMTSEAAGGPPQPGFFGGWLGRNCDPLFLNRDPNAANFEMPEFNLGREMSDGRLQVRKELAKRMSGQQTADRKLQDMDGFQARAFDLLTSPATQKAFRLDLEPARVRDGYGRNLYGQSVLLGRRLIDAGARVASIAWANGSWDTHDNNFNRLKNDLLPQMDMAVASLLDDLVVRGLLERTLVVVMGEFGRTPKVSPTAGRDHCNSCYTLLLAGGGIKAGYVHGSSDKIGLHPNSSAVGPADIVATIYDCLGIDHKVELRDRLDRPFQLVPWGSPIRELQG